MKNGSYTLVIPPDDYPGKRYRDRYAPAHHVMHWKWTGKVPKEGEVLYFKNGDRHDFSPGNLEIISRSEHAKITNHARAVRTIQARCATCRRRFITEVRRDRATSPYCSDRCNSKGGSIREGSNG